MSHILILSHVFPPATDGGSTFLFQLAKHLAPHHSISVLTTNCYSTDDFIKFKTPTIHKPKNLLPAVTIYRLPVSKIAHLPLRFLNKIIPGLKNPFLTGPFLSPLSLLVVFFKIKKHPPHIIISGPLPTTMPLYGHFLSRLFKAKHIVLPCFHTTDPNFSHPWLLSVLRLADLLLPFTEFEKNFYHQKLKIPLKKLYLYSGGVEKTFLSPRSKLLPRHLLFLGNQSAHKGIELLFSAYSRLFSPSFPPPILIIAGRETLYTPQIKKTYRHLSPAIKKQIRFITRFSKTDKKKLIDRAHFLILPSSHESFGLVLIEALARKVPFLVSNLPATQELVKKTHGGLTFKLNDHRDLQKKMSILLKNPTLTSNIGKIGYTYISKNLVWEKLISGFEKKCLKNLLKK